MCECHPTGPLAINCIVPPHMLEVLSKRARGPVADAAKEQLALSEKARDERTELSGRPMQRDAAQPTGFVTALAGERDPDAQSQPRGL